MEASIEIDESSLWKDIFYYQGRAGSFHFVTFMRTFHELYLLPLVSDFDELHICVVLYDLGWVGDLLTFYQ